MRARQSKRAKPLRHDLVAMTLVAAAAAIAQDANAATNVFAQFEDIKGESTDDKHKEQSDVLSWSWNIQGQAKKNGCGSELFLLKPVDRASPGLVDAMSKGKLLPTATLRVRKSVEASDYLVIKMSEVAIMLVSPSGSQNGEAVEQVALAYATATMTYEFQQPGGNVTKLPATVDGCPP